MESLTTLERAIRLQKVELFSELETEQLALLASIAQPVSLGAGDKLVEQNSSQTALYIVLNGGIEVRRDGNLMLTAVRDETIGNWAFFDEQPSVVEAVAAEDSDLLKIEREDFFDLLADHREITRGLFQALFHRLRTLLSAGLGG